MYRSGSPGMFPQYLSDPFAGPSGITSSATTDVSSCQEGGGGTGDHAGPPPKYGAAAGENVDISAWSETSSSQQMGATCVQHKDEPGRKKRVLQHLLLEICSLAQDCENVLDSFPLPVSRARALRGWETFDSNKTKFGSPLPSTRGHELRAINECSLEEGWERWLEAPSTQRDTDKTAATQRTQKENYFDKCRKSDIAEDLAQNLHTYFIDVLLPKTEDVRNKVETLRASVVVLKDKLKRSEDFARRQSEQLDDLQQDLHSERETESSRHKSLAVVLENLRSENQEFRSQLDTSERELVAERQKNIACEQRLAEMSERINDEEMRRATNGHEHTVEVREELVSTRRELRRLMAAGMKKDLIIEELKTALQKEIRRAAETGMLSSTSSLQMKRQLMLRSASNASLEEASKHWLCSTGSARSQQKSVPQGFASAMVALTRAADSSRGTASPAPPSALFRHSSMKYCGASADLASISLWKGKKYSSGQRNRSLPPRQNKRLGVGVDEVVLPSSPTLASELLGSEHAADFFQGRQSTPSSARTRLKNIRQRFFQKDTSAKGELCSSDALPDIPYGNTLAHEIGKPIHESNGETVHLESIASHQIPTAYLTDAMSLRASKNTEFTSQPFTDRALELEDAQRRPCISEQQAVDIEHLLLSHEDVLAQIRERSSDDRSHVRDVQSQQLGGAKHSETNVFQHVREQVIPRGREIQSFHTKVDSRLEDTEKLHSRPQGNEGEILDSHQNALKSQREYHKLLQLYEQRQFAHEQERLCMLQQVEQLKNRVRKLEKPCVKEEIEKEQHADQKLAHHEKVHDTNMDTSRAKQQVWLPVLRQRQEECTQLKQQLEHEMLEKMKLHRLLREKIEEFQFDKVKMLDRLEQQQRKTNELEQKLEWQTHKHEQNLQLQRERHEQECENIKRDLRQTQADRATMEESTVQLRHKIKSLQSQLERQDQELKELKRSQLESMLEREPVEGGSSGAVKRPKRIGEQLEGKGRSFKTEEDDAEIHWQREGVRTKLLQTQICLEGGSKDYLDSSTSKSHIEGEEKTALAIAVSPCVGASAKSFCAEVDQIGSALKVAREEVTVLQRVCAALKSEVASSKRKREKDFENYKSAIKAKNAERKRQVQQMLEVNESLTLRKEEVETRLVDQLQEAQSDIHALIRLQVQQALLRRSGTLLGGVQGAVNIPSLSITTSSLWQSYEQKLSESLQLTDRSGSFRSARRSSRPIDLYRPVALSINTLRPQTYREYVEDDERGNRNLVEFETTRESKNADLYEFLPAFVGKLRNKLFSKDMQLSAYGRPLSTTTRNYLETTEDRSTLQHKTWLRQSSAFSTKSAGSARVHGHASRRLTQRRAAESNI